LPTALDFAGVETPASLDGKSLKPYLAGSEAADRISIGETDYPLRFGWAPLRSVRTEGLKLIEAPQPELYDLHADPGELSNRYQPREASAQKLRGILAETHAKIEGNAETAATQSLPDPKDKIEEQNLLHRAMIAADDGRPAEARAVLERALELDPKSPTGLRQLGELEFQAGEYAKAADHLKRAREVRPDDSTVALILGEALEKTGDLTGARDALEESLKLVPGQFDARLLLGQIYLRLNDAKAAEDEFQAALLLRSKSVDAAIGAARAQIADHRFIDAVATLKPFSELNPENPDLFKALSEAYDAAGQKEEATRVKNRAERLRNGHARRQQDSATPIPSPNPE